MATEQAAPENIQVVRNGGPSTLDLYRAALGPVRTDYYLKAFTRFDAAGHTGPSWNTLAALITLNWLSFRKLWGAALAYVGIAVFAALLLLGIGALVFKWPAETQWALAGIGLLLAVLVPGLWGNAWLYAACTKRVEAALAATTTVEEACARLGKSAPGRRRMGVQSALNALLIAGIVAAVMAGQGTHLWPAAANQPPETQGMVSGTVQSGPVTSGPVATGLVTPAASAPAVAASTPVAAPASVPASAPASAPTPMASAAAASASAPEVVKKATPEVPAEKPKAAASEPKPAAQAPQTKAEKRVAAQTKAREARAAALAKAEQKKAAKAAKEAKSAQAAKPATAAASAPVPTQPKEDKYLINVGLFADENNARNATVRLQDAGLPAMAQAVKSSKGPRTRVRVGPFDSEAEAERAAETIRSLQLEAQVFKP